MSEILFKRIDTVFLPVRDLNRAVQWYTETLRVTILWQSPGAAALKLGESSLTLLQERFPGLPEPVQAGAPFQPAAEPVLSLYAADIEHAHRLLLEQGVDVGAILESGEVKEFQFFDPDGNQLNVCGWPEQADQ